MANSLEYKKNGRDSMSSISVIIPFFQKESGLLRRAVKSIFDQSNISKHKICVVIVDDGSPVTALGEVEEFMTSSSYALTVLHQANAGPASARNRALNHVISSTDFVAFLDSDDYWSNQHLARAMSSFDVGADFYFGDLQRVGETCSLFSQHGFPDPVQLEAHNAAADVYGFCGDAMETVIKGFVWTSTVVYRAWPYRDLRFPENQRRFGEDQYTWLRICQRNPNVYVSTSCETYMGKGVSIYTDQTYGTPSQIERLGDELRYRRRASKTISLTPNAQKRMQEATSAARRRIAREILHQLRRGRLQHALRGVSLAPGALRQMPRLVLQGLGRPTRDQ